MSVDTPPLYATAANLPAYTPDAEQNERVLDTARPSTTAIRNEFEYVNGNLLLNLGPKRYGLFRPVYGWNACIDGFVQLKKKISNVLSLVVSIEGHVTTGVSERGFLTDMTKTRVLNKTQTLFDAASGQPYPVSGSRYEFSLPLPSYVMGGTLPLPPTFTALHPGVAAEVTYFIKVEMARKGVLRQNLRLKTFFLYLPRTYAPLLQLTDDGEKSEDSSCWHVSPVLPKLPCGATVNSATHLCVSVAFPRPLEYAAGSTIPFYLTVTSRTADEALQSLFSGLSVQLVRITVLKIGGRQSLRTTVQGGGEVFRVSEQGNVRTMFGGVQSKAGESSWAVEGVDVKYVVRVRLGPREDVPSLANTLPTYMHEQLVTLRTNERAWDDQDERQPALARVTRISR